ncbi:MAG: SUMF1/EgtB/PvdO family nonheme iron enzyme [bacterium]
MLNKNIIKELNKPRIFNILNEQAGFDVEMAIGQDYRNLDIFKLSQTNVTELIIIPSIEKMNSIYEIKAKLYDVKRNEMLKSYTQECNCPFEEVIFWIIPDMCGQFGKTNFDIPTQCPDNMIVIRAGNFTMGSDEAYDNNPKITKTTRNFCIDKYEFPNEQGKLPVFGSNWYQANESCLDKGKRLCYEEEWEKACRGEYNFIYPYGNAYEKKKCVTKEDKLQPSGSFQSCRGQNEIYDMSGNISEWTGSVWDDNIQNKVIKGGAWNSGKDNSRCTLRYSNKPSTISKTIGFRCCKSLY